MEWDNLIVLAIVSLSQNTHFWISFESFLFINLYVLTYSVISRTSVFFLPAWFQTKHGFQHFSECKYLTLPDIRNKRLRDLLYYSVSPTCLRLDACFSPTITIGRKTIKKSFKAFVDVDNCHFIVTLGFEGWRKSLILISYDWGRSNKSNITVV